MSRGRWAGSEGIEGKQEISEPGSRQDGKVWEGRWFYFGAGQAEGKPDKQTNKLGRRKAGVGRDGRQVSLGTEQLGSKRDCQAVG